MTKVLVVDDLADLADSTATVLSLLGYETSTAYGGREAIAAADNERPDVVLLDLQMPLVDGFQAARAIRSRYPGHPPRIVALSAVAGPKLVHQLENCGFDGYLIKPAKVGDLLAMMQH